MKKRGKKAQITAFILIGVVLIIIVLFLFYMKTIQPERINIEQLQINPVQAYVENCIELTAKNALLNLGLKGGFIYTPPYVEEFKPKPPIIYLYNYDKYPLNSHSVMPSLQSWEQDISKYIEEELPNCINRFEPLKEQGYEIEFGRVIATTNIRDKDILIMVNYPLTIKKKNSIKKISDFEVKIPLRLKDVYYEVWRAIQAIYFADERGDKEIARALRKSYLKKFGFYPKFSLDFITWDRRLDTKYQIYDETTTIWLIRVPYKTKEDFNFIFAAKHKRINI